MASPEGVRRVEAYVLTRLRPQTRGGVVLEGRLDGALIRLYSVHLDVLGFAHKSRQLAAVLADHATRPRADLALIAGDLNTFGIANLPSWNALRTAARAAGFEDLTAGAGWTHSIRRLGLRQKLDAVLATTMTGLHHRSWTLPVDASDHLPLFVELSWP